MIDRLGIRTEDRVFTIAFGVSLAAHLLFLVGQLLQLDWFTVRRDLGPIEVVYNYEMARESAQDMRAQLSRAQRDAIGAPVPGSFGERMVQEQLRARGLTDDRLLSAFRKVPRHRFVPRDYHTEAYADHPLPIGEQQTISQPYIVALMISHLRLQGHERVLELGAGSGYQLAILAELALEVYSIERIPELAERAERRLRECGYANVHLSAGNGTLGWPEHAPYDAIIVSAAAPEIPSALIRQLGDPGRLLIPLGSSKAQMLTLIVQRQGQVSRHELTPCTFVPLIGAEGWPDVSDP